MDRSCVNVGSRSGVVVQIKAKSKSLLPKTLNPNLHELRCEEKRGEGQSRIGLGLCLCHKKIEVVGDVHRAGLRPSFGRVLWPECARDCVVAASNTKSVSALRQVHDVGHRCFS